MELAGRKLWLDSEGWLRFSPCPEELVAHHDQAPLNWIGYQGHKGRDGGWKNLSVENGEAILESVDGKRWILDFGTTPPSWWTGWVIRSKQELAHD